MVEIFIWEFFEVFVVCLDYNFFCLNLKFKEECVIFLFFKLNECKRLYWVIIK